MPADVADAARPPVGVREERVPVLDGVRGLAIALVMAYHFSFLGDAWASSSPVDRALWRVTGAGWAGVDLFFVLSGFLITGILYNAKAIAQHYFRSFYARRILRIFPVYYAFLLLIVVGLPLVHPDARDSVKAIWHDMWWYATYLTGVRSVFDSSLRPESLFVGHLWSLSVEEQFYLLWPFVVLLLERRALIAVCLAAIVAAFGVRAGLVLAGTPLSIPYSLMPARMDLLGVGALIALAAREPADLRLLSRWLRPVAAGSLIVLLALAVPRGDLSPPFDGWVVTLGFSGVALLFGALVLAALEAAPGAALQRVFSNQAIMWLGRYSYAIYLFHLPIATILVQRSDIVDRMPEVFGSTLPGIAVFSALAGAIAIAAAWLSWQVWEQQFLRLKSRFPYNAVPAPKRLSA